MINDLHASVADGADDREVRRFLSEVHTRIAAHFAVEERIMRRSRYPAYDAHRTDHACLLDDILDIIDDYAEVYSLAPDLLDIRLEDWFMVHFHMLFLDGVYVEHPDGSLGFRWVKAPTGSELARLT